jgi:diguanylate cyclase (GGDEF)-like protein
MAGMTDYTGVSMDVVLAHLRDWRDETAGCIEALKHLEGEVERHRDQLDRPNDIITHVRFSIDLFGRYLGDFDRLLVELPRFVTAAHVEIVQQIYDSASHEEEHCVRFSRDHIDRQMKDEALRWLVDQIYQQSRSMMIDYQDLSNLVPRLRTFVGTAPKVDRELEQKFGILFSPAQEQRDFDLWAAEAASASGYAIGVGFLDIDDFKRLNSAFTESIVDSAILPPFQRLVRDASLHRGAAYRHGGEELLIMLPNCGVDETARFAENLRARIEAQEFAIEGHGRVHLTVSAGVATWPGHGKTLDEVIHAANKAEHAAKEAGKNCVHVATT